MTDTTKKSTEADQKPEKSPSLETGQVGAGHVGPIGIMLTMAYLILFSILLLYGLVQFWPSAAPTVEAGTPPSPVNFLFWTFPITEEIRLFLIVAMAGALGGLVHTLRSFYWYVGNRGLVMSWLMKYILLPYVGATLGLIFYFVIRGGFFSPGASVEQTSPFGFAAIAGLVGMFSEQAVLKLKEVAETLLTKPQQGSDPGVKDDGGKE